jgi:RES domain-containing protein
VTLWRISNQSDLAGAGGMRAAGRWHSIGHPIVYLSEHPASCLLEVLAHGLSIAEAPRPYQWLEVTVDAGVTAESVGDLPDDWSQNMAVTRKMGDAWLRARSSALLKVPSVLTPATANFLLNPRHPLAKEVRIAARWVMAPTSASGPGARPRRSRATADARREPARLRPAS